MRNMKKFLFFSLSALFLLSPLMADAQQEQKQKSPEEIAYEHVEQLEKELHLTSAQAFYVDSILVHNYTGVMEEFETMHKGGMQNPETYKSLNEKWEARTEEAMKKVLDEQQYIGFLKHIGKGKEYKKGKDGKYVLKKGKKKGKEEKK